MSNFNFFSWILSKIVSLALLIFKYIPRGIGGGGGIVGRGGTVADIWAMTEGESEVRGGGGGGGEGGGGVCGGGINILFYFLIFFN